VLRPGGRAVVEMGWRVPEGTETHQAIGGMWIWNEVDARSLVEEAGFVDVSVTYRDWSGDSRLARASNRLTKMEDMRVVRGIRAR